MVEIQKVSNNTPLISSNLSSNLDVSEFESSGMTPEAQRAMRLIKQLHQGLQNNSQGGEQSSSDTQGDSTGNSEPSEQSTKFGDSFYGEVKTTTKVPRTSNRFKSVKVKGVFTKKASKEGDPEDYVRVVRHATNTELCVPEKDVTVLECPKNKQPLLDFLNTKENSDKKKEQKKQKSVDEVKKDKLRFNFKTFDPEDQLRIAILSGQQNIWMVGPAGCGKSTMVRLAAETFDLPYYCISCGIGTSAAEFVGYKYPTREATKFAEYYSKPSVLLLDEFTALDPAVAQVVNAALANGEIETTTGLVKRHPECVIIATSNTFGSGASRQYVANNQLDSSTIDRFVGGIIEVNYSNKYESQFDSEVVTYVQNLRDIIAANDLRRIASTRMIQAGHKMKQLYYKDWKDLLIVNWSYEEKEIVLHSMQKINADEGLSREFIIAA